MLNILYVHGFASCGNSSKTQFLDQFPNVTAPDLPYQPEKVLQYLRQLINEMDNDELILVGTSLGDWYQPFQCGNIMI